MKNSSVALVASAVVLCACAVEVTDETSSPLSYNPPINEQTFTVRVQSTTNVSNVELMVPGVGIDVMSPVGNDLYEGSLPLATCPTVAEFEVEVTTTNLFGSDTNTYPEAGLFAHQITGVPDECAEFADGVAQTFIVDRTEDFPDFIVGNGTCAGVIDGELGCSLRAAVMEANAKPGNDLILVPVSRFTLTRLESGVFVESGNGIEDAVLDLDITESVTIRGVGGTTRDVWDFFIESNQRTENLRDNPNNNFTFAKIDGNGIDRIFQVSGTGVVLRLENIALVNGSADGPGGAILNDGTLVMERVAIADSEVTKPQTPQIGGGAIHNNGLLVANDIALTQNTAGGDVNNPRGGALVNDGTATIRRALIAYNDARFGNAIYNEADGVLTLENATVHDHKWDGGNPVSVVSNAGQMDLAFVTLSDNSISEARDLLRNITGGTMTLRNTLMIRNTANHCAGTIASSGGNVTDASCGLSGNGTTNDHIDVALAAFGALDLRGGFTPVYPFSKPSSGSSLFDPTDEATSLSYPFWDQRGEGFDRRVDADGDGARIPDPGAWEYTP